MSGIFWEDTGKVRARARVMPYIPETGWTPPKDFPNLSSAKAIALDTETYDPELLTNGPGWARGKGHLVGVSIGVDGGKWYFPMRHEIESHHNMEPSKVLKWLADVLDTPSVYKIGANLMYDIGWLLQEGVSVTGPLFDVQFAEALINEGARVGLDILAKKYLDDGKESDLLYQWCADYYGGPVNGKQRANIYRSPARLVGPYAESDADLPLRLADVLYKELHKEHLWDLFDTECRLIPLLVDMRAAGVTVDIDAAERARVTLLQKADDHNKQLRDLVGFEVNVNANASLAKAFDALSLKYQTTEKGNPSFTKQFLESVTHPAVEHVTQVRTLKKMVSTFIDGYILGSHVNGKIYCQFHPLKGESGGTRSGRYSSCLPDTSRIETPAGDKLLRDVNVGDAVLTHRGRVKPVVHKFDNGNADVFRITLCSGERIECTANHRLYTNLGFKSLEAIYDSITKMDQHTTKHKSCSTTIPRKRRQNKRTDRAHNGYARSEYTSVPESAYEACGIKIITGTALFEEQNRTEKPNAWEIARTAPQFQRRRRRQQRVSSCPKASLVHRAQKVKARISTSCRNVRKIKHNGNTGRFLCAPHRLRQNKQHSGQFSFNDSRGARTLTFKRSAIKRVDYVGIQRVFDLEVEDDHTFIANNIVVHNSSPNLQNIPSRDKVLAPLLRGMFTPDPGHARWICADYSQIEYRMLVHFALGAGADAVRQQFIDCPDTDYHKLTQQLVEAHTGQKIERKPIKNINFGLLYGMGVDKLSAQIGLSKKDGKKLFDAYHKGAPFAKATMDHYMDVAQKTGTIETILGRKSRFNLWEPVKWDANSIALPYHKALSAYGQIRRAHTHKAVNRLLQGSAADLMKMAMLKCYEYGVFAETGVPRLTVHDELDFSDPGGKDTAFKEMVRIMETALPLKIPVKVDVEAGPDWGHVG